MLQITNEKNMSNPIVLSRSISGRNSAPWSRIETILSTDQRHDKQHKIIYFELHPHHGENTWDFLMLIEKCIDLPMDRQTPYVTVANVRQYLNEQHKLPYKINAECNSPHLKDTGGSRRRQWWKQNIMFSYVSWKVYWFTDLSPNPLFYPCICSLIIKWRTKKSHIL